MSIRLHNTNGSPQQQMLEVVARVLEVSPDSLHWERALTEQAGATMDMGEIVVAVEEAFGVTVLADDLEILKSPRDLLDYVEGYRG